MQPAQKSHKTQGNMNGAFPHGSNVKGECLDGSRASAVHVQATSQKSRTVVQGQGPVSFPVPVAVDSAIHFKKKDEAGLVFWLTLAFACDARDATSLGIS